MTKINKQKLLTLLQKYSINGKTTTPVLWIKDEESEQIQITFKPDDRSFIGRVSFSNFDIGQSNELGVSSQLPKILSALDDDLVMEVRYERNKPNHLDFDDSSSSAKFMLVDTSIEKITEQRKYLSAPIFNGGKPEKVAQFAFAKETMDRFVKSKNALSDSKHFALRKEDVQIEFIINYATDYQSNQIKFSVGAEIFSDFDVLIYDGDNFKDIITANKDCISSMLTMYDQGLLELSFAGDGWTSEYYLMKFDN